MSAPYLPYTTVHNDRWDLIAYKMYGDPFAFEDIIVANPTVAIAPVLEGGIQLRIPLRDPVAVASSSLPPWKRP